MAGSALTDPRTRFVLWAVVGAGGCLALLGALSIGVFVAPVVVLLALVLLRTTKADRSMFGAVAGVSLPLFYVAWLNRGGPGNVCRVEENLTTCSEQWSPWPWVVAGIALAAVGIALFRRLGNKRVTQPI
jgi:hypothetical protein